MISESRIVQVSESVVNSQDDVARGFSLSGSSVCPWPRSSLPSSSAGKTSCRAEVVAIQCLRCSAGYLIRMEENKGRLPNAAGRGGSVAQQGYWWGLGAADERGEKCGEGSEAQMPGSTKLLPLKVDGWKCRSNKK